MGDTAFIALISLIEEQKCVGALKLQSNNLTDKSIFSLCRSLEDVHHKDIELIDVSENPNLTDDSATALASLLSRLPNLAEVRMEACPKISRSKLNSLEFQCDEKRAKLNK